MKFLRRLLGGDHGGDPVKVPDWAQFMDRPAFFRFAELVQQEVKKRHPAGIVDWEQGIWIDRPGSKIERGLLNLAQFCNQIPPNERQSEVARFIELSSSFGEDKPLPFDQLKSRLKVRVYHPDYAPPGFLVTAPYADYFNLALALDYPDKVESVNQKTVDRWGISLEELFKIGFNNVFQQDPVEISSVGDDPETALYFLESESLFTASHALMFEQKIQFDDDKGLLVIIPHRHFVGRHKVSKAVGWVIPALANLAAEMYESGPGSITKEVLWLRRAQFERVAIVDGLVVAPPELVALLG